MSNKAERFEGSTEELKSKLAFIRVTDGSAALALAMDQEIRNREGAAHFDVPEAGQESKLWEILAEAYVRGWYHGTEGRRTDDGKRDVADELSVNNPILVNAGPFFNALRRIRTIHLESDQPDVTIRSLMVAEADNALYDAGYRESPNMEGETDGTEVRKDQADGTPAPSQGADPADAGQPGQPGD